MAKILVTGSAGLIGAAIAKNLRQIGYEVADCDLRFTENPLSFFADGIEDILQECAGVIHLAAISRVIHGQQYPKLCAEINVRGSMKLLGLCKKLSHKPWFIYGSSREVYGEPRRLPVSEDAVFNPVNKYAQGKVLVEQAVTDLENFGFNTAILRFSNVYGGLMDHSDRVVPAFCINALTNQEINIDGKECVFDFTYIDDVVDGIKLVTELLSDAKKLDSPIHFTTGKGRSLQQLAHIIINTTQSNSKINYHPPRDFDVSRFVGDYAIAQRLLGWQPKYLLEEGIEDFVSKLKNSTDACPNNVKMEIYEDIKSYSWLPALL